MPVLFVFILSVIRLILGEYLGKLQQEEHIRTQTLQFHKIFKMRVVFDPETENWDFLINQTGTGDFFVGLPYQRGYGQCGSGVGGIFRSLMKYLIPLGRKIGPALAKEGVDTIGRILNNNSTDLKTAAVSEAKTGLRNLLNKAATNLEPQAGSGRKKKAIKKPTLKIQKTKFAYCKTPPKKFDVLPGSKKQRFDALGEY